MVKLRCTVYSVECFRPLLQRPSVQSSRARVFKITKARGLNCTTRAVCKDVDCMLARLYACIP